MVKIIEDFEKSSLGSEFTDQTNISLSTSYAYNGSKSLVMDDGSNPIGRYEPSELAGGQKIDYIELYWIETSGQFGGALTINDSSDQIIAGFATDNPQWNIAFGGAFTGDLQWSNVYDPSDYNDWTRVKMVFDWNNSSVTYEIEDMADGDTYTDSLNMVNFGGNNDVESVEFREFTGGPFGTSNTTMWIDDITVDGLSTTTSASTSFNSISNITDSGADFEAQVDSQTAADDAELGFEIFDSADNLINTITTDTGVDLTSKSLPYVFSDTTSSLSSDTTYKVRSFVDHQSSKSTSAKTQFTTKISSVSLDYTGTYKGFKTAGTGNKIRSIDIDINLQTNSTAFSNFKTQIENKIMESIETGTGDDLETGVVLDNGTVLHSDSLIKSVDDRSIDAKFAVQESETSSSDDITNFQIQDQNGNIYWQSDQSIDGGQDVIIRVKFISK